PLLRDADQRHRAGARGGRSLEIRTGDPLLALALPKRTTGMPPAVANLCTPAVQASPIFPNAADEGMKNPRCQRKNWHTMPTLCNRGTYACRKIRSTDRQVSVT